VKETNLKRLHTYFNYTSLLEKKNCRDSKNISGQGLGEGRDFKKYRSFMAVNYSVF
jgi:hypothetical protein